MSVVLNVDVGDFELEPFARSCRCNLPNAAVSSSVFGSAAIVIWERIRQRTAVLHQWVPVFEDAAAILELDQIFSILATCAVRTSRVFKKPPFKNGLIFDSFLAE
jgi:hypothetical protein